MINIAMKNMNRFFMFVCLSTSCPTLLFATMFATILSVIVVELECFQMNISIIQLKT